MGGRPVHGIIESMNRSKQTELITAAAGGDLDALQCLVVEHHAALRSDIERRIAIRYRASIDPDDVLQDAYVAAVLFEGRRPADAIEALMTRRLKAE